MSAFCETCAAPTATPAPTKSDVPAADTGVAPSPDWDVVPVFFGTDRKRQDQAKRIGFGTDRGRRLEVGRALVTVPKAHQVPNVERPWAINPTLSTPSSGAPPTSS